MTTTTPKPDHPKLTDAVRSEFLKVHRTNGVVKARDYLGRALGVAKSQKYLWATRLLGDQPKTGSFKQKSEKSGGQPEPIPQKQAATAEFSGDNGVASAVDENVKTLADLLRVCQVDLEVWEVERYVVNKWATARKDKSVNLTWSEGVMDGSVNDRSGMTVHPIFQVKAWLKKKRAATDFKLLLQTFIDSAATHAPKHFTYKPIPKSRDCMYVLNIQDLHLGKLAWSPETGGPDYDIRIGERVYDNAVDELMRKAPLDRIEEVVMIIGSDFFQVDNDKSTTTAGTYVDSDSRLTKIFQVGSAMLTRAVEKIAANFRVRLVVVAGNHDATVSQFLGHYLTAWFRSHSNVVIDNTPKSRKYVPYGKTLIGFDHGDETKMADLPLIMMRENQETVSQFKFFEMLTGHRHHEETNEYKGVKVRIAPVLCAEDKYHHKKGYIGGIRTSQALLYGKDSGLEAIYYTTPLD